MSKPDVLRKGLYLEKELLEAKKNGYKIILQKGDTAKELIIL